MRVLAYDPYLSEDVIHAKGVEKIDSLDSLMAACDFVSINCPLVAETRGMIGAKQYAAMQKHAFLITSARGGICDEAALADALEQKLLAGAGIDVYETEPPSPDDALFKLPNATLAPHLAWYSEDSGWKIRELIVLEIDRFLVGKPPRYLAGRVQLAGAPAGSEPRP